MRNGVKKLSEGETSNQSRKGIISILFAVSLLLSLMSIFHSAQVNVTDFDTRVVIGGDDLALNKLDADTPQDQAVADWSDSQLETYNSKIQEQQLGLKEFQESRRRQQAVLSSNLSNNTNVHFEAKDNNVQSSLHQKIIVEQEPSSQSQLQSLDEDGGPLRGMEYLASKQDDDTARQKSSRWLHFDAKNRERLQQQHQQQQKDKVQRHKRIQFKRTINNQKLSPTQQGSYHNINNKQPPALYFNNNDNHQSSTSTSIVKRQSIARKPQKRKSQSPPTLLVHYHKTGTYFLMDFMDSMRTFQSHHGIQVKSKTAHKEQHKHDPESGCPQLDHYYPGSLWRINAPDFFCDLTTDHLPNHTKIIHFIRDPIDMTLSNYLYHAQRPTPEIWVQTLRNPCLSNDSMLKFVSPFLNLSLNETMAVKNMCKQIFHHGNFYEALRKLPPYDGLRLASAQFLLAQNYESGGDILRMANNIKRLKEWSNGENNNDDNLLTITMDQLLQDNREQIVTKIVNFIESDILPNKASKLDLAKRVALKMEDISFKKRTKNPEENHVTQDLLNAKGRQRMKAKLEEDEILGPLLLKLRSLL